MSALFTLPLLFLGRLMLTLRNEMMAAEWPSVAELAAAFFIALFTPKIVIGLFPLTLAQVFYIHFQTGWHSSGEFASAAISLAILTLAAFVMVRLSRVAYDSYLKRLGCVLAYLWIWYTGSLLFIGQVFI
jgi:hypothetical protein